jgi:hypothetical protein
MTRVVIHESGIRSLALREDGPVGRYLALKANGVDVRAHQNALGQGGGPRPRSRALFASIRNAGIFQNPQGLYALIGTDVKSPRQGFPYGLALEKGMPGPAGNLPTFRNGRTQGAYRYPFLEPALCSEFGKPFTGS